MEVYYILFNFPYNNHLILMCGNRSLKCIQILLKSIFVQRKRDLQFTYKITLRRVRVTIVDVEKQ
jgi:hypothetical protein